MKLIGFKALSLMVLLTIASGFNTANAALILDGDNKLSRVTNIDVDGVLYDVEFIDGTCADLFDGCNATSTLPFNSITELGNAFTALMMVPGFSSYFGVNTPYGMLTGLEIFNSNSIWTPYNIIGFDADYLEVRVFDNTLASSVFVQVSPSSALDTYITTGLATYAVWTPTEVSEPTTVAILALGLLGLGLRRKLRG